MVEATCNPDEPDSQDIPRIPEPGIPPTRRGTGCLHDELLATITRCEMEFDLTPIDVVGVMNYIAFTVMQRAWEDDKEDDA